MGAGSEDRNRKDSTKGFAGLSSLVSDVDTTVSEALRNAEAAPHAVNREVAPAAASESSPSTAKRPSANRPPPQPTGGASRWKWVIGISVAVGLIWVISRSNERPQNTPPTYTTVTPSMPAPAATTTLLSQTPTIQQVRRPTEEQPPVGNGLTLTMPQLRYCTAENIRLDAAKTVINSYNDIEIDRFNGLVAHYNSRCGQFRYKTGNLESARSDVERYRMEIEAEGRARFSRSPKPASSSVQPIEVPAAGPDIMVQSIQRRLNTLGYNSGVEDGLLGYVTQAAISAFQRDEKIIVDGKASNALLKRLLEKAESTVPSAAQRKPSTISAQPPASNQRESSAPPNSFVSGPSWYCNDGFRKVDDSCVSVKAPPNSFVSGPSWYCKDGFRKVGDSCDAVKAPPNSFISGSNWYCRDGFRKVGDSCNPI